MFNSWVNNPTTLSPKVIGSLTSADKNLAVATTVNDGDSTGVTISNTPDGFVGVNVNRDGPYGLADGDAQRANSDFYFSGDGGTTARTHITIIATDTLHINPTIVGFNLAAATDIIDLHYEV